MHHQSNNPHRHPKKVEFASTRLDAIDSEAPAEVGTASSTWDTETDHILSYFLGGGDNIASGPSSVPSADFASTRTSTNSGLSSLVAAAAVGEDQQQELQMPPPTPAVQFYSNSRHGPHHSSRTSGSRSGETKSGDAQPQLAVTSHSSSSSSLSSMAAALVSGVGPGMQHYQAQQLQMQRVAASGQNPGDESPISPAAMIGSGQENLLLPSPSSPGSSGVRDTVGGGVDASMGPPLPRDPKWPQPGATCNTVSSMPPLPPQSMMAPMLPQPPGAAIAQSIMSGGMMRAPTTAQQKQQMMYAAAAAAHAASLSGHEGRATTAVESEEKRAKRLERNRESARKSRRRKKERLNALSAQVNELHNKIETERRKHINAMVPAIQASRQQKINELIKSGNTDGLQEKLAEIVRGSGPTSPIMRTVIDFQYSQLKQLTLPSYQKMLLWFTLRDESYFLAGKEQYAAKQQELQQQEGSSESSSTRPSHGKVSSKQIGDELLNGPSSKQPKGAKKKRDTDGSQDDTKSNPTCVAYDAARFWPLFCFELRFSVDQEDRFLVIHKQATRGVTVGDEHVDYGSRDLPSKRSQLSAAVSTAESLSKATGSIGHAIAQREERAWLGIMNPKQVAAYQAWLSNTANRERCRTAVAGRFGASSMYSASSVSTSQSNANSTERKEMSLHDICRRLNEVLQISTRQNDNSKMSED